MYNSEVIVKNLIQNRDLSRKCNIRLLTDKNRRGSGEILIHTNLRASLRPNLTYTTTRFGKPV